MNIENKKSIINVIYAISFFYAIVSTFSLLTNAINVSEYIPGITGYGPIYMENFRKEMVELCTIGAAISITGLAFFIVSLFLKHNKIFDIILSTVIPCIIIGLLVSIFVAKNWIGLVFYDSKFYTHLYDYQLYTQAQSLYIQQAITMTLLYGIYIYFMCTKRSIK